MAMSRKAHRIAGRSVAVLLGVLILALLSIAAVPAPAAAQCVYDPGGYRGGGYYTTTAAGNDPTVYQNYGCSVFDMSRGNLNPSYRDWRGWLDSSSGHWQSSSYQYDHTPGVGLEFFGDVAATTHEHAQTDGGSGWRNQEYH